MLSASLISAVLGTQLPGAGTIYLGQDIKFVAPVYLGDTVCANAEVVQLNIEKNIYKLTKVCTNQEGKVVIQGSAITMPPSA